MREGERAEGRKGGREEGREGGERKEGRNAGSKEKKGYYLAFFVSCDSLAC